MKKHFGILIKVLTQIVLTEILNMPLSRTYPQAQKYKLRFVLLRACKICTCQEATSASDLLLVVLEILRYTF